MQLGRPIICGAGAPNEPNDVADLRRRVGAGLRAATLNLLSGDEAHRVLSVSSVLAEVLDTFRPLHKPDPLLADQVRVAHRITDIVPRLSALELEVADRVERFVSHLTMFEDLLKLNTVAASDVQMGTSTAASR